MIFTSGLNFLTSSRNGTDNQLDSAKDATPKRVRANAFS